MKKKLKNKYKKYFNTNQEYFNFINKKEIKIESVTYTKNNKIVVVYYLFK